MVRLCRHKFAASGTAPSESVPLLGLITSQDGDAVAVGRTLREPREGRSTWTMVFDLKDLPGVGTGTFTLSIFRVHGASCALVPLGVPVVNLSFDDVLAR